MIQVLPAVMKWLASTIVVMQVLGCADVPRVRRTAVGDAPAVRILFIGNSYTFYNGGIDRILARLTAARGQSIVSASSTSPGKSLEWHWNQGRARELIARGDWDWVVLQDFSTQALDRIPGEDESRDRR